MPMKSLEEIRKALDLQTLQDKNPNLYDVLKELQDTVAAQQLVIDNHESRIAALENAS